MAVERGEAAGLDVLAVLVVRVGAAWLLTAETSKIAAHATAAISLVRVDHFVRWIKTKMVIGRKKMAATMTSQRGKPLDVIGEAGIGDTESGDTGA